MEKTNNIADEFYSLAPKYRTKERLQELIDNQIAEARREEREKLRVHIEREAIDPLVDNSKSFGVGDLVEAIRRTLRHQDYQS